jgi:hypothetical protein
MCPIPNGFRYLARSILNLARSILNLARSIFHPFHRNAPLSEACESVWSVSWLWWLLIEREGKGNIALQIQNTAPQISETVRNRTHVHINFFS